MRNVMIDIETLGLVPGSVILSIAAVAFDQVNDDVIFDASISVSDSIDCEMEVDDKTVEWHREIGGHALKERDRHYRSLVDALCDFSWAVSSDDIVWANSPSFDVVLIEAAYRTVDRPSPFFYRNLRDLRTALAANPLFDPKSVPFVGQPHDPVDDCRHQIALLRASGFPL